MSETAIPVMSVQPKPMRVSRAMTFWECEAECHRVGKHGAEVWEPLRLQDPVPPDAHPYCYFGNRVAFYTDATHQSIITATEYYDLGAAPSPHLLWFGGRWWERGGARIVCRDGTWFAVHDVRDNTRAAQWANQRASHD